MIRAWLHRRRGHHIHAHHTRHAVVYLCSCGGLW